MTSLAACSLSSDVNEARTLEAEAKDKTHEAESEAEAKLMRPRPSKFV